MVYVEERKNELPKQGKEFAHPACSARQFQEHILSELHFIRPSRVYLRCLKPHPQEERSQAEFKRKAMQPQTTVRYRFTPSRLTTRKTNHVKINKTEGNTRWQRGGEIETLKKLNTERPYDLATPPLDR